MTDKERVDGLIKIMDHLEDSVLIAETIGLPTLGSAIGSIGVSILLSVGKTIIDNDAVPTPSATVN